MEITVTLLGTGTSSGVPMVGCDCEVCRSEDPRDNRLRTSAMLEIKKDDGEKVRIIIDAGTDFRYQMLRERVKWIDGIILTHEHKDHIGGIDDVRAFNYFQKQPTEIYCEKKVSEVVRKDYNYAFADLMEHYAGVPEINLNIIDEKPFTIRGVEITPIRVMHCKLPIFGYKIGGVCYITDANAISEHSMELIKGCDVLILNALRHAKHISHFTLKEALSIIEEAKPKRAILTHVSHQMGLFKDINEKLPSGVEFGYDRMKIFTTFVD